MCQLETIVIGGKFPGSIARAYRWVTTRFQHVRDDGYQGRGLAMQRRRRGSPGQEKARSGEGDRAFCRLVLHMHQPPATTDNDE
jgi:hypothetical protein